MEELIKRIDRAADLYALWPSHIVHSFQIFHLLLIGWLIKPNISQLNFQSISIWE